MKIISTQRMQAHFAARYTKSAGIISEGCCYGLLRTGVVQGLLPHKYTGQFIFVTYADDLYSNVVQGLGLLFGRSASICLAVRQQDEDLRSDEVEQATSLAGYHDFGKDLKQCISGVSKTEWCLRKSGYLRQHARLVVVGVEIELYL